jgi:hypothetical protein
VSAVATGAAPPTDRVRAEWRARIAAEYTSAAITQNLTLWLIQAGAPPDLIDAGLAIVADELAHSRLSHDVYVAAGGDQAPQLVQQQLGLARKGAMLDDILLACVRSFCLGETVAVPLFSHLRERCTEPVARTALDRILRDEVRHREFGWDLLDWLCALEDDVPPRIAPHLHLMLDSLHASYGADDSNDISDAERAWGLAPPREYGDILAETIIRDFRPRFAVRGITL